MHNSDIRFQILMHACVCVCVCVCVHCFLFRWRLKPEYTLTPVGKQAYKSYRRILFFIFGEFKKSRTFSVRGRFRCRVGVCIRKQHNVLQRGTQTSENPNIQYLTDMWCLYFLAKSNVTFKETSSNYSDLL